jgi:hypothetical protein
MVGKGEEGKLVVVGMGMSAILRGRGSGRGFK